MYKFIFPIAIALLLITISSPGQTVTINTPPNNGTISGGMGSLNYHVSEYIYMEAEIGSTNFTTTGTAINYINLRMLQPSDIPNQAFTNVTIYLKNTTASSFTGLFGTYSTAGYTMVYSGNFPADITGWIGVNLTTPFIRTQGTNLQMMIERTDNILPYIATAPPMWETMHSVNSLARTYNGTTPLSASTTLGLSERVSIQLKHALANDAGIFDVVSVGKLPLAYGGSQDIVAIIKNTGTATLTNLPVTLQVSGANTYTFTQAITSLAAGAITTITFGGYTPSATGNNVLSVSVPGDDDNSNNTLSQNQVITTNIFALSNNDAFTPDNSVGFGSFDGLILVKMPVYISSALAGVRVSLTTDNAASGNIIYGVLLSSTGNIIAQSPNYTIQNADLGQFVTFNFPVPQALTPATYYIGLAQTSSANGFYPVNVQAHKRNSSYVADLTGGIVTADFTATGSLMIEGIFSTALPVSLSSFSGIRKENFHQLNWTTASEKNNSGFLVERSVDGKKFSTIGYVAAKAENGNSNTPLSYSYSDEKPLPGINYYRLKQTDRDGKFSYSSVVVLQGVKGFYLSSLYPNPTRDALSLAITCENAEKATINIIDMTGKLIKQIAVGLSTGENNFSLNVGSLAAGDYTLQVINSNMEIKTQRFIKN